MEIRTLLWVKHGKRKSRERDPPSAKKQGSGDSLNKRGGVTGESETNSGSTDGAMESVWAEWPYGVGMAAGSTVIPL